MQDIRILVTKKKKNKNAFAPDQEITASNFR